ncbi:hypothetical protein GQ43DRAFT_46007 [Delitschia confertaspora ATCC 74209]|uniref:DUF7728 domain-containing protein n=1 Tax=Delitschia confertaspora ATCC 74209 TaxID=1513339 RepID=A0A9P4MSM4_9PLEO|nr:hypothetical protein GQ43DRAFT_46007 [Delitschia confertaspora ATCC 74209]
MMFRSLGVLATLALVVNSVLIPPNVGLESLGDDNAMETLAIDPFKRTVALECAGCAVAQKEGNMLVWTAQTGNSLLLDFEVGPNEDILLIDGVQLYPPIFGAFSEPFTVRQIDPRAQTDQHSIHLRVTGYTFRYDSAETVTEAGTELLPMTFRITSIESQRVDSPVLTIYLLKDIEGRLMIASFETAPATLESSPKGKTKECEEWPMLCKWKSILSDKYNSLKSSMEQGCRMHKGNGNPMKHHGMHGKPPHTFHPGQIGQGHPHHHGGPHGDRTHHRVHMFMRGALFTIVIPVLIGVLAGTITYLIGMALGYLIAIIIAKFRGESMYITLLEDEEQVPGDIDSEKQSFSELPKYEDAPPVYEEAAEKEVVDETR